MNTGLLLRRRYEVAVVAALVATVLLCRFGFPGGAPNGVLLEGIIRGSRQALLAAGIILIYRSTRIINFAQAVLGAVAGNLMFNLGAVGIEGLGRAPFVVAFLVAIVVAVAMSLLAELIFVRRFFNSPRLVLTVVTIVMAPTLAGWPAFADTFPFWNRGEDVVQLRASGEYPVIAGDLGFDLFPFRFGFADLLSLVVCVGAFVALALFLKRSRMGTAVRGTAENSDRALLLGINVKMLSSVVWGMAGLASGLATALSVADQGAAGVPVAPGALLTPLAAVVIGRLASLPITVLAALGLGMLEQALAWSFPQQRAFPVVLFALILAGLLAQRPRYSRLASAAASAWRATAEVRPTPREMLELAGIRRLRLLLMVAGGALVLIFPQAYSLSQAKDASLIAIYVVVTLSLVILTGWGGQISLGQFALVAIGAMSGGWLTGNLGLSFWLALPLAVGFTAGFATLVGIPALRVRGPFLAVATLAFAAAGDALYRSGAAEFIADDRIERPRLLFLSFASERSYYYLCVGAAVIASLAVRRLRAGRPGRVLIAIRDDEYGVAPFGVDPGRTRLAVFALSGALAGLAGVLYVHHQGSFSLGQDAETGLAGLSITMFIIAMVGGVTSVSGAVLGAVYYGAVTTLIPDPPVQQLASSAGLLVLLMVAPGGLSAIAYGARDALLRLVALRRRMVVPSLFEDVDPEAVLNAKSTFAPATDGRGLDALDPHRRYAEPSVLYPTSTVEAR